jgi:DNA-binding MarR family transcriptional regulator
MSFTDQHMRRVHRILSIFRTIAPTIPVQVVQTLVLVAMNEGKTLGELATLAGAQNSTMSRHTLDLSDRNRHGKPGHGLIERSKDNADLRATRFTLSPKGRALLNKVAQEQTND